LPAALSALFVRDTLNRPLTINGFVGPELRHRRASGKKNQLLFTAGIGDEKATVCSASFAPAREAKTTATATAKSYLA